MKSEGMSYISSDFFQIDVTLLCKNMNWKRENLPISIKFKKNSFTSKKESGSIRSLFVSIQMLLLVFISIFFFFFLFFSIIKSRVLHTQNTFFLGVTPPNPCLFMKLKIFLSSFHLINYHLSLIKYIYKMLRNVKEKFYKYSENFINKSWWDVTSLVVANARLK